jgi:hypothetical protein
MIIESKKSSLTAIGQSIHQHRIAKENVDNFRQLKYHHEASQAILLVYCIEQPSASLCNFSFWAVVCSGPLLPRRVQNAMSDLVVERLTRWCQSVPILHVGRVMLRLFLDIWHRCNGFSCKASSPPSSSRLVSALARRLLSNPVPNSQDSVCQA